MAGVDCLTGGWSAGWGGQGGVSAHSISARTRQENARKESLTPASAPQATLVLSNSKTANQAPGHV